MNKKMFVIGMTLCGIALIKASRDDVEYVMALCEKALEQMKVIWREEHE